mmetsp:Transcript_18595/g.60465  ORF Transcript_18595/g.60465 Transcript_18595/m.60465 type:complete len:362 (+) Transcript_18595:393-1478(+)
MNVAWSWLTMKQTCNAASWNLAQHGLSRRWKWRYCRLCRARLCWSARRALLTQQLSCVPLLAVWHRQGCPCMRGKHRLCFWHGRACQKKQSPWDQAVARAASAAESYRGSMPGTGTNQQPRRRGKAMVEEASRSFFALQRSFLHQHGSELRRDLSAAFDGPVELNAAPISQAVAAPFMDFCSKAGGAELVPVYHGTDAKNHTSIFTRGLLVPGHGNDVKVRNGLSHGTGIYTSKIGSAWLSRGFCTEPRVLVCGLWDDAVPVTVTKVLGNFQVTKESDSVRHIGAAIVVFDANRLVPLFEAIARPRSQPSQPPQLSRVLGAVDQQRGQISRAPHSRKPCAKKFESAVVAFLARRAAMKRRT